MKTRRTLVNGSTLKVESVKNDFDETFFISTVDGKDFPDNENSNMGLSIEQAADFFENWLNDNINS